MEPDTDAIAGCKNLSQFRIKELKDVLTFVGHSKQGKKQDLVDRIVALLYDEGSLGLDKNNVNGKEGLIETINHVYRPDKLNFSSEINHGLIVHLRSKSVEECGSSRSFKKILSSPYRFWSFYRHLALRRIRPLHMDSLLRSYTLATAFICLSLHILRCQLGID